MKKKLIKCPKCGRWTDEGRKKLREEALNNPFYFNKDEFKEPVSTLIERLRTDLSIIRGKLGDIKKAYGREESIEYIEGGLTCIMVSLYSTYKEFLKFEERQKANEKETSN